MSTDGNTPSGIDLIRAERARQVEQEGWTPEHDDRHQFGGPMLGPLYVAAMQYLSADGPDAPVSNLWPWERKWWKPKDRVRNLVRAGALLLAEHDRISRKTYFGDKPVTPHPMLLMLVDGVAVAIDKELADAAQ